MVQPNNRLDKFFDENEFQYYLSLGNEYMTHANQTILLYKVDKKRSDFDDLYNETPVDNIYFQPPITITAVIKLEEPSNNPYLKSGELVNEEYGKLRVSVFSEYLENMGLSIDMGDFFAYDITNKGLVFFEVVTINEKQMDNAKTFMGYKAYWTAFEAVPSTKQLKYFER